MSSESELLRGLEPGAVPGGLGIGDDAACLPDGTLITVDALVSGIHFEAEADPAAVADKLLRVNLSDIAAMGGRPTYALLTLAVAAGFDAAGFLAALQASCRAFDVVLVGGDTVSAPVTMLSLTLLGTSGKHVARRDAAAEGDVVFVTGPLGGSLRHGRHLRPEPRLEEGRWLVGMGIRCLMDLSDGLAAGLHAIATASAVGLDCNGPAVPLHDDTYGADPAERLEAAFSDGEDFELLGTAPPALWASLKEGIYPLTAIGVITAGSEVRWRDTEGGEWRQLEATGFDHSW